jgi:hypothetical protein
MMRAKRRAVPKPARVPSGSEAGHRETSGLSVPAEEQQRELLRGRQGRPMCSSDEGQT